MRKIVNNGVVKKYMYLGEVAYLHVREKPESEVFADLLPYLVTVNNLEQTFMYDGKDFYLDEPNHVEQNKEIAEHKLLVATMAEDGKTEEEIREFMEGKGTQYIDRVLYILEASNNLDALITKAITSL